MNQTEKSRKSDLLLYSPINSRKSSNNVRPKKEKFVVEKKRWYMFIIYGLLMMSTGIIWISLSPVIDIVRDLYGANDYIVVMISVLHFALFTPGMIGAIIYYNKYNLRYGLIIGSVLQAIGAGMK